MKVKIWGPHLCQEEPQACPGGLGELSWGDRLLFKSDRPALTWDISCLEYDYCIFTKTF